MTSPLFVRDIAAGPNGRGQAGSGSAPPIGSARRLCCRLCLAWLVAFLGSSIVDAAPPYPRVYGPAGSLYGPTQAEYQYQLRYGRPWWGRSAGTSLAVTGVPVPVGIGVPVAVPFVYGPCPVPWATGWGLSINTGWGGVFWYERYYGVPWVSGPIYGPVAPQITLGWPKPDPAGGMPAGSVGAGADRKARGTAEPVAFTNEVIRRTLEENRRRWEQPLAIESEPTPPLKRPKRTSTAAARTKSRILAARAQQWMRRGEFHTALQRYRQATEAAPDLAEGWYGQALALAAIGRFELAADRLKTAVLRDAEWPTNAPPLDDIFGNDTPLRKLSVLDRAAAWVREDIRDPDRLFLLGALLFFDGQFDKARPFLEAAYRLAGGGAHIAAFFDSNTVEGDNDDAGGAAAEYGPEHVRRKLEAVTAPPPKPPAPDDEPGGRNAPPERKSPMAPKSRRAGPDLPTPPGPR